MVLFIGPKQAHVRKTTLYWAILATEHSFPSGVANCLSSLLRAKLLFTVLITFGFNLVPADWQRQLL
jgi:hypothetical protein